MIYRWEFSVGKHNKIVVGSRTDPYSLRETERTVSFLNDCCREVEFCDFRETGVVKKAGKNRRKWRWRDLYLPLKLLREDKIDVVVSPGEMVPVNPGEGFRVAVVLKRGNPFDVLISRYNTIFDDHPRDAAIAISGAGRKGQLLYYRSGLNLIDRNCGRQSLNSLIENDQIDGVVTSAMEAEAFELQERVVEVFTPSIAVPEAGQGCIAMIVRESDREIEKLLKRRDHSPSRMEFNLERELLRNLSGYQEGSVAVMASVKDEEFKLESAVISPDGSRKISSEVWGWRGEEDKAIAELREEILAAGGEDIISR